MKGFSKSRFDVKNWPNDPDAQAALDQFFDEIDPNGHYIPTLSGGGLDFTGADLSGLELGGAELSSARLAGVRMRQTSLYQAWIRSADLTRTDFTGADLRKALITHCTAPHSVLVGARLTGADLSDSDFRHSDFERTPLDDADLSGTDLRGADLHECSLGAFPFDANLRRARLGGANVEAMTGEVRHPIDIGIDESNIVEGHVLQQWFSDNGAPDIAVKSRH